jgi:nitrilase
MATRAKVALQASSARPRARRILTAEIDLDLVAQARRLFDPAGHYHRPDVFELHVDTRTRPVVTTRG